MNTTAGWADDPERSSLWALRLMRWVALSAGRPLTRVLLHPIALYFLIANGKARRASRQYLGRALRRPVRWADVYRHIHRFAATVLDRVYFLQGRFDQFEMSSTGYEPVQAQLARGEGAMLVGAHLGSFEALRAIAQDNGARVAMLMYEDNARLINAALAAVAPQAQLHTIALGRAGAMLALRRWLDEGGLAGLLADRTLPGRSGRAPGRPKPACAPSGGRSEATWGLHSDRSRTLSIDFLGQPVRFSDGPFRLAAMLRRPVFFMAGLYHGGKRYELRFVEIADFRPQAASGGVDTDQRVREALHRYVALLEALCTESPYNWFNFFDFWAVDATNPAADPPATAPSDDTR